VLNKCDGRIEALERELVQRQDVVNRALQAHNDMRQKQSELLKDFDVCTCSLEYAIVVIAHHKNDQPHTGQCTGDYDSVVVDAVCRTRNRQLSPSQPT